MKIKKISLFLTGLMCASSVFAEVSSWLVRVRGIDVIPDVSSSRITKIGGHVTDISNQVTGELDFSYFINNNIAAELILATTRHSVVAHHTALGTVNLGHVSVLPPTLTAQYHFLPQHMVNPYAGVGINLTHFYDVNHGPVPIITGLHYGNTVGPAFQLGTDIAINDHFSLNLDVKKILMRTDVKVFTTAAGVLKTRVTIDPWVVGGGLGYRF